MQSSQVRADFVQQTTLADMQLLRFPKDIHTAPTKMSEKNFSNSSNLITNFNKISDYILPGVL